MSSFRGVENRRHYTTFKTRKGNTAENVSMMETYICAIEKLLHFSSLLGPCFVTDEEAGLFSFRASGSRRVISLPASPLGNRNEKKTSLHVPCEAVRNALTETRREVKRVALSPARCRQSKFLTFHRTTALQHCKLQMADFSPPWFVNCLWARSFHFSFTIKSLNGQAVRCCMYRNTCEARLSVTSAVLGLRSFW